jgi:predicted kinase
MSEVAFVAMDLIYRGHAHFAYRFLDRYLQSTGDYQGVPLLRYYMIYRALVRAKVAAMRGRQETTSRDTRRSLSQRVRSHIELAATLARAAPPALIVMHGLSGSGKTRVSQRLLEEIGALRIRSDVERKRLHGRSATAHTDSTLAEGMYDAASSLATYERLRQLARPVLLGGFNTIVDAAFLRRQQRDRLRSLAREMGVAFAIAHTHASESVLRERIARRAQHENDASEATVEVLDHQLQTQEPLGVDEQAETCVIDSEHDDERATVEKAKQLLKI